VSSFFAAKAPVRRSLELMETGPYDAAVWRQLADQLALPALAVPERYGGQGFGLGELGIALYEMGRVVYFGPFLANVLAGQALLLGGDENACEAYLPAVATGERTATLAIFEPGAAWRIDAPATAAVGDGESWRLNGEKAWVLDGASADTLLVSATCDGDLGLFAVDAAGEGVSVESVSVLDLTRPLARVSLDSTPATRIGGGDTKEVLEAVLDRAIAALACEQAGGIRGCLEMTAAYAAERIQFGRAIGSYQAVRHRLADMFVLAETAESVARNAVRALDEHDGDARVAVGVAGSWCSDAYLHAAGDTIQLHGGIGFTWEHPAHLFFKRAKASAMLFGDAAWQRERVAPDLLSIPTARGVST